MKNKFEVIENPHGYDLTKCVRGQDVEYLNERAFFDTEFGARVKLKYNEKTYVSKSSGKSVVELSTYSWTGSELRAIHYYGSLKFNTADLMKEGTNTFMITPEIPFFGRCSIDLTRELQQKEIDADYVRWEYYRAGDRVVAFESLEQLVERAKHVFATLFSQDWELYIDQSV